MLSFISKLLFFTLVVSSCSKPGICPSMVVTDISGTNSNKMKVGKNGGFTKNKKVIDTRDKANPFGFDPSYKYPIKKREEKGLFSKKVMRSWKKY